MKKCIIVGAAKVRKKEVKKLLASCDKRDIIIAADGGYDKLHKWKIPAQMLIGDGDSAKHVDKKSLKTVFCETQEQMKECLEQFSEKQKQITIALPTQKDDTDLLACIRAGMWLGCKEFYLLGVFGGARVDHSFANVQCMRYLHQHGCKVYLYYKDAVITIAERERIVFPAGMKGYCSVFALSPVVSGVTIKNLKYQVKEQQFSNQYPIGVSNEFIGEAAAITAGEGQLAIIYPQKGAQKIQRISLKN